MKLLSSEYKEQKEKKQMQLETGSDDNSMENIVSMYPHKGPRLPPLQLHMQEKEGRGNNEHALQNLSLMNKHDKD